MTVAFARAQIDAGADCILLADHATRDLCSPRAYEQFLLPLHRRLAEEDPRAGHPAHLREHGGPHRHDRPDRPGLLPLALSLSMVWHNGKGDKILGRDAIRDLKFDFDNNHPIITPPKTQMTATLSAPPKTRRVVFPFTAIVGQEEMKLALLLNVIDPKIGGVMIMGDRGTGKSTTIRALADLLPEIEVVANDPFNSDPHLP